MAEILNHPWLTNKSFLGTELRFLQQPSLEFDPISDPELLDPLISSSSDLDGRIWETLKVLWREKSDEEILNSLTTQGYIDQLCTTFLFHILIAFLFRCNVQKLTCKLLQERSWRLEVQASSGASSSHSSSSSPCSENNSK